MKKKRRKVKENNINNRNSFANYIMTFIAKSLLVVIIFLLSMIYIKTSDSNKKKFEKLVYTNNLSFAKIYNVYKKYLGDVIPFKGDNNVKKVSNEAFIFDKVNKENNGYIFEISNSNSISALKGGIVVDKKKSKIYGNMIKIQDRNDVCITYGFLDDLNVSLYDYVSKGEIIGSINNKVYIIFEKDGKYLKYDEFI